VPETKQTGNKPNDLPAILRRARSGDQSALPALRQVLEAGELQGLLARQPLQVGDPGRLDRPPLVGLEYDRQAIQEGGLPQAEQGGTDLELPADLGLGHRSGQDVEDGLCLELRRKRASRSSSHRTAPK
jgi:hypothetical protein